MANEKKTKVKKEASNTRFICIILFLKTRIKIILK